MGARDTRTRLAPEVRRELILDAAEGELLHRPVHEVTFDVVADAAGVSRALVYNYFNDRAGLLVAVELRALNRLDQALRPCLDPQLRPGDQVRALAEVYVTFAAAHGPVWRLLGEPVGVQHPSVRAARRVRVDRLAASWGAGRRALVAARTVTAMLESAVLWSDDDLPSAVVVDAVCSILADGLEGAGVGPAVGPAGAVVT